MSIRLLTYVWIFGIVQAQNPCRVNVIFSLEASTYVKSEGESFIYDQINKVQSTYQKWTISPNSVRAALPKPIGCNQGGNWNLQNDTNSLNNVVSSIKRFLYTCFQQNSLSDYITSLNNQILQSQPVDPANYVFVIFTATTDTNDVQQAINLRKQFFDPKGYGLIVVVVEPQTAANLAQLATYGVYDLGDPIFIQDISSAVCNGKIQPITTTTQVNTLPPATTTTTAPIITMATTPPKVATASEGATYETTIEGFTEGFTTTPPIFITPSDYYEFSTVSSFFDIDDDLQEIEKKIIELRAHRQAQKQKPKPRKINDKEILTNKVSHKKISAKKQNNKIVKHSKLPTHSKTRFVQNKTAMKNFH